MIIKAELWDKMQFLFRHYYDRMVHCVLYYDKPINIDILKQIIVWTVEKVPVLHSSFRYNAVEPYWETKDYTIDDIVTVDLNCNDIEQSINDVIYECIPTDNNVQIKIGAFCDNNKSALAIIVNHMCFDGGDFKYFLYKLSENYNKLLNKNYNLEIKQGSRSYDAVYTNLTDEERKIAEGLYKNISNVKDEHTFPLTNDSKLDKTAIHRRKIPEDLFLKFKQIGKVMGVTVNDLILTFYITALYKIGNYSKQDSLAIPCMVDLRRYMEDSTKTGLTNHTGFMICNIEKLGNDINDTLIQVIRSIHKNKSDKYMGLYSLPLLKLAYGIFPYIISETAIRIGYLNPLIGMSNIGVLNINKLKLGNSNLIDGFMTGGVKYKPYMQLALTTIKNEITMTVAIRGNDEDKKIVNKFFDYIIDAINDFIELNKDKLN